MELVASVISESPKLRMISRLPPNSLDTAQLRSPLPAFSHVTSIVTNNDVLALSRASLEQLLHLDLQWIPLSDMISLRGVFLRATNLEVCHLTALSGIGIHHLRHLAFLRELCITVFINDADLVNVAIYAPQLETLDIASSFCTNYGTNWFH